MKKVLDAKFSEKKRSCHLQALKREVSVLQKLKGCLNVVELHDVFEDEVSPPPHRCYKGQSSELYVCVCLCASVRSKTR